ncbi:MAG: RNase adapter RapZ [Deltaproteobacteria bacterium]|nr:RNase adapter RapZ [Deltaproteobacteria bacterium]MCW5801899.1 RNase adapter RapZ [Deltaproteobacteria bacterium]
MQIVIVTGLSGAGKSTALRALEDIEFFCVDNIPVPLVAPMVDHLAHEGERDKLAIAIDSRQRRNLAAWQATLTKLRGAGHRLEVMFLDATDEVLLRRFSETRRRHPLSGDDLVDGIRRDRELMGELRHGAAVVDTTNLNMHQLKSIIQDRYGGTGKLAVTLVSFGFKHGLPIDFNLVFDVRFLPNPYFEPTLTHLDGRDPEVSRFVFGPDGSELVQKVEGLLRFTLPHFQKEGKLYVTIAVGCTGGRHRSVAIVEELRRRLGGEWDIMVRHRDVERGL